MITTEPIHETANLTLWDTEKGLEIRLEGNTHSVVVGHPKNTDAAKRFMTNAEKHIGNLRKFHQHPV